MLFVSLFLFLAINNTQISNTSSSFDYLFANNSSQFQLFFPLKCATTTSMCDFRSFVPFSLEEIKQKSIIIFFSLDFFIVFITKKKRNKKHVIIISICTHIRAIQTINISQKSNTNRSLQPISE